MARRATLTGFRLLKQILAETAALGVTFRICGCAVRIEGLDRLPSDVYRRLAPFIADGSLREYLDGDGPDGEALDFLEVLGVTAILVESRSAARWAVRQIMYDLAEYGRALGIDIETAPRTGYGTRPIAHINVDGSYSARQPESRDKTGLDPHRSGIACLQLYAGGQSAFIFRKAALQVLLQSHWLRRQHLVIHNAAFELSFLQKVGYRAPKHRRMRNRLDCTMQATGLLVGVGFGGSGRSLANAADKLLQLPEVPKALQTSDWSADHLSDGQLAYAAADAVLAYRLWPIVRRELRSKERWTAYELQRQAIPAVVDMQLRGLGIDRDEHTRQTESWSKQLAEARREYHQLTGNIPPSTPAETRAWLAGVLDHETLANWPHTQTSGELSIESKHLKRLSRIESARPVLLLLAHSKLLSTFGSKLAQYLNPITGRIHCSYGIAATKAGRFSASSPNLQQLPSSKAPAFKKCIVAAPGNLLVGCDWSQIEMRAAAWISGDQALTQVFAEGRDIHAETAASIAGIPIESVTKEQRQGAKAVNFGSIYGIGPRSLAESAFANYGVEMTETEAKFALDRFFAAYAGLARWREHNHQRCMQRGYVLIGAGRVVEAAWEPYGLSFPQCCNLPVQGIAADAMLRAIALVHKRLRDEGIRGGLIASVHDELLLEVHENDSALAGETLQQTMIEVFRLTFPGAPSTGVAETTIGNTWYLIKHPEEN
jgi:DNA polymerase I-like protein with 3'-5' exonuclease and polymerase domains